MTDILDLIDNATEHRCACGCNTQLPEDGPSAWFASQGCQRRWNESNATNPADVYDRPDAGNGWLSDEMVVSDGSTVAPEVEGTLAYLDRMLASVPTPPWAAPAGAMVDQASEAVEAFMRTVVVPGSMEGRSGLVTTAATWEQAATNDVLTPESLRRTLEAYGLVVRGRTEPDGQPSSPEPLRRMASVTSPLDWMDQTRDYWSPPTPPPGSEGFYARLFTRDEVARGGWHLIPDGSDASHHYATARPSLRPVLHAATPAPWPDYVMERIEALPDASMTITGFYEPYSCWIDEALWYAANRRSKVRRMHTSYSSRLRSRRRRNRR